MPDATTNLHSDLGRSLRDQFFALSSNPPDSAPRREAQQLFQAEVDAIEVAPVGELDGLGLSYHPSARFKLLRYLEAHGIDARVRPLFARAEARPELAAVFVDPEELSYRTFESILPLDRYFEGVALGLALTDRQRIGAGKQPSGYTFTLALPEPARAALLGLDALGLYVAPLNQASRGGQRFIFHAAALAEALGLAVRDALPKRWLAKFSHVNPVFRCNRFEPGDAEFQSHFDTPYYDAAREQVSRYTLLIYLTGGSAGEAQPALRIADDVALAEIPAMTCVVFPQGLEHAGAPYLDGRKLFLRTELIFTDASVTHEPGIAAMFAKATYLTGESVFAPELARRTHALYDRAAAAHFGARSDAEPGETYLHKKFRSLEFVTNGYDYWFPRSLSLPEAAALALLDTLNCKIGGAAFRKLCEVEVHTAEVCQPDAWIWSLLTDRPERPAPTLVPLALALLFPPCEAVDERLCCPFHAFSCWDANRAPEIVDLYQRAQRYARRLLASAPITMLGEEVFLDLDKFVVADGKIHVLSDRALTPVNFAACWNDGSDASNYLDLEVLVDAPQLLVPPILFVESDRGHHLMLDLFRNSWMVEQRERAVPVPRIRNFGVAQYESGEIETTPWIDAASAALTEDERADGVDEPWWADGEPILGVLYGDVE